MLGPNRPKSNLSKPDSPGSTLAACTCFCDNFDSPPTAPSSSFPAVAVAKEEVAGEKAEDVEVDKMQLHSVPAYLDT